MFRPTLVKAGPLPARRYRASVEGDQSLGISTTAGLTSRSPSATRAARRHDVCLCRQVIEIEHWTLIPLWLTSSRMLSLRVMSNETGSHWETQSPGARLISH